MKLHRVLEIAETALINYMADLRRDATKSIQYLDSLRDVREAHVEIRTMAIKAKQESEN